MRKLAVLGITLGALVLLVPSTASAYTSTPLWKCRASAVYASLAGNNRVEPVVANGNASTSGNKSPDRAQCASEEAGADNLATPLGIPQSVIAAQSASAKTTITPELGLAIDQKVEAVSRVEKLALPLGSTTVILGVGAANATAKGSCVNGAPKLEGSSSMLDLTLGGVPVSLNELLGQIQKLVEPLGVLVDVKFNEQVKSGTSLIVRAAHIKLLGANQATPLLDLVIAESKVDADQFTCDPNKQIPGFGGQICPTGSTFDVMNTVCIITVDKNGNSTAGSGLPATGIIVVGKPFQGPSGGTVMPLAEAIRKYGRKLCLRVPGPKFAIIGTAKTDRITGTNTKDRILSLGGNDSVDGGRGDDCLDLGSGSDHGTGGIGNDRIIGDSGNDTIRGDLGKDVITGGAGNDKIAGGASADRIYGNAGNDILSSQYGADFVDAGAGNDVVNIAQQGPSATAHCGSGTDIIRLNNKEKSKTRGCEKRYVLKDR